MNAVMLRRLLDARGAFLSIDEFGPDRQTTWLELAEVEAFGFPLERHPVLGVACVGPAERLCPDQIEEGLNTRLIGRRVSVWSRVASTNDLAIKAASSGANEGLVVLAEEQTAGRGRRGRSWSSPPRSSILMSALSFPAGPFAEPSWLTALGAVATAEVVSRWTGKFARIKWPNDVLVEGKKIAGILVERAVGAVLGIGLNVNVILRDFPDHVEATATSLQILSGSKLDRSELARDLIQTLDGYYEISSCLGSRSTCGIMGSPGRGSGRACRSQYTPRRTDGKTRKTRSRSRIGPQKRRWHESRSPEPRHPLDGKAGSVPWETLRCLTRTLEDSWSATGPLDRLHTVGDSRS